MSYTAREFAAILITHHESFSAKVYRDGFTSTIYNIGWGTTCIDRTPVGPLYPDVTKEQAITWVYNAVDECIQILPLPKHILPHEAGAIISLSYNLGYTAVRKSTLMKYISIGDNMRAAVEFPLWCRAVGEMRYGLLLRRQSEQYTFLSGEFMFTPTDDYKLLPTV
jgi:lysozyme